jgi:hypothetical protein
MKKSPDVYGASDVKVLETSNDKELEMTEGEGEDHS